LEEIAHKAGIAERVVFLGQVENVPALLAQVDVLVHTTDREPFGRVFLEAMAARKPIVAFDNGGAAEIVRNGETGYLASPGDVRAMANAVTRLLASATLRQCMGEAGRARVERLYTIETHAAAVLAVYEAVLR
jgi:glycosyltransferase involved in cell wall biosynthesis